MGSPMVDYKLQVKASNLSARLPMKLTISQKVYIPSWAQFPDDFHPIFFASQKLTEQTQRRA